MSFESFIAARVLRGSGRAISRPIVTIATIAIAVGMAMMILSIAVLQGFQDEIRNKVVGFGSHLQIISIGDNFSKESKRVPIAQDFYPSLVEQPGVDHIQIFAVMPGILETDEGLQGIAIKGVSDDYEWSYFQDKIVKGRPVMVADSGISYEVMISDYHARRLRLDTGDRVTTYFVQGDADIKPRPLRVCGIYKTGMEEFDRRFVFVDIEHIQKISNWGLQAQIKSEVTQKGVQVTGLAFGGSGKFDYHWSDSTWVGKGPHLFIPQADTSLRLVVWDDNHTLPDTAWLSVKYPPLPGDSPSVSLTTSGGSWRHYCGGFEVLLDDYQNLLAADDFIDLKVPYNMQTRVITEQYPEIFNWLEMLDINVVIIVALMIFIAVINMTSALLIIILERTRMIGLLKALGAEGRSIVFIFLQNAAFVILVGVVSGNALGIGMAALQDQFSIISLDPVNYFVDSVPIKFDFATFLLLDLLTVVICVIMLILPALYVNNISPVRALRFD